MRSSWQALEADGASAITTGEPPRNYASGDSATDGKRCQPRRKGYTARGSSGSPSNTSTKYFAAHEGYLSGQ